MAAKQIRKLWKDEEGLGTLEILMIVAVLVAIAVVFRKWIISWINSLFLETQTELNEDTGTLETPNP